jgi:hypothetical protein
MSPEAVTGRLRTMDELWLLSTKLMNSKRVATQSPSSKKERAAKIQDYIRQILFYEWDPIGINDSGPTDEYDAYIARVYRLLIEKCSEDDLINYLFKLERDSMGMSPVSAELLRPVAAKLMSLDVHLAR